MLTAISNKKLTKLVATRPSQEDSPFSHTPSPFPPFSSVPPEKFLFLLPIGRPFTGTHRPTIYRAFPNFISFHLISLHLISFYFCLFPLELEGEPALLCTSLCLLGILLRVVLSAITALLNAPAPSTREFPHFPIYSLPMLMMKPRPFFTSSLTRATGINRGGRVFHW